MKKILMIIFALFSLSAKAQITAEEIKTGLAGKEWKIVKYEVFGVADAPKPEQLNDKIFLKTDMSFVIVENGKEYKGKWNVMNPSVYILCKATTGAWTKTYKIISIGEKESVLEYKDPDLIKTKYYLELK
jgi:hypothetical protein